MLSTIGSDNPDPRGNSTPKRIRTTSRGQQIYPGVPCVQPLFASKKQKTKRITRNATQRQVSATYVLLELLSECVSCCYSKALFVSSRFFSTGDLCELMHEQNRRRRERDSFNFPSRARPSNGIQSVLVFSCN